MTVGATNTISFVPPQRRLRSLVGLVSTAVTAAFVLLGTGLVVSDHWQRAVYREAYLPELEKAAKAHPTDGYLLTLLGLRYAEAGEFRPAARVLEQATGTGTKAPAVWLTWAACEAADNRPLKAEQILGYAINSKNCQPPAPARAALNRLQSLKSTATHDITGGEAAHAISPDEPTQVTASFLGTADMFDRLQDWKSRRDPEQSGFDFRRRDASQNPNDPLAQVRWIEALRRNNRLRDGQKAGQAALVAFPQNPKIITAYADVLYSGGALAAAGVQYRRALTLDPNYPPAVLGLAKVGLDTQLFRIAVSNYEKATQLTPQDADAWVGLGRACYSDSHRYDKALAAFETAGRLAPARTDFFPYWADALVANYRVADAEALLLRRLAEAPDDARTHYLLGRLIYDNKATPERLALAEKHLRRSLEIEPNAPIVKIALAKLLLDKADTVQNAEAGALMGDVMESDPLNVLAARLLATAYQKIGRKDRAEETQRLALQLAEYAEHVRTLEDRERENPRDVTIHQNLATLYATGGEADKARRQQDMVYMLTHHRALAEQGLTRLSNAVSRAPAANANEVARGLSSQTGATGSVSGTASPSPVPPKSPSTGY